MPRFFSSAIHRFVWVGGIGFLVDSALLTLLVWAGWQPLLARIPSFMAAVTVTWWLNRRYTFALRARSRMRAEYSHYVLVQCLGAALNFGVYSACLAWSSLLQAFPVLALGIASLAAMSWNFWAMQRLVFAPSARR